MKIEQLGGDVFKVTISGPTKTEHKVTVTDNQHKRLTANRVTKESLLGFLIQVSFEERAKHINFIVC